MHSQRNATCVYPTEVTRFFNINTLFIICLAVPGAPDLFNFKIRYTNEYKIIPMNIPKRSVPFTDLTDITINLALYTL